MIVQFWIDWGKSEKVSICITNIRILVWPPLIAHSSEKLITQLYKTDQCDKEDPTVITFKSQSIQWYQHLHRLADYQAKHIPLICGSFHLRSEKVAAKIPKGSRTHFFIKIWYIQLSGQLIKLLLSTSVISWYFWPSRAKMFQAVAFISQVIL
jgi:hypothetical protein